MYTVYLGTCKRDKATSAQLQPFLYFNLFIYSSISILGFVVTLYSAKIPSVTLLLFHILSFKDKHHFCDKKKMKLRIEYLGEDLDRLISVV